jgi:hypothetical protein
MIGLCLTCCFDVVDLPADTVFLHLERGAVFAVEDVVCVGYVFFELSCDFPLCVVALGRRRGEETSGCDFLCVSENLLAPPLQFSVPRRRRQAADEGSCGVLLVLALCSNVSRSHAYRSWGCSLARPQACP